MQPIDPSSILSAPHKRALLPIWLHIAIGTVTSIAGFFVALAFSVAVDHRLGLSGQGLAGFGILAASTFCGAMLPTVITFKLIPARCSKCSGRCWALKPRLNQTLKYVCEHCGKVIDTRMRPGDG